MFYDSQHNAFNSIDDILRHYAKNQEGLVSVIKRCVPPENQS